MSEPIKISDGDPLDLANNQPGVRLCDDSPWKLLQALKDSSKAYDLLQSELIQAREEILRLRHWLEEIEAESNGGNGQTIEGGMARDALDGTKANILPIGSQEAEIQRLRDALEKVIRFGDKCIEFCNEDFLMHHIRYDIPDICREALAMEKINQEKREE